MAIVDQRRDEALDAWRGMACLLVYFVHKGVTLEIPPWIVPGFTGVHMFFVLSGYLLSWPYLRAIDNREALPPIGSYLLRRLIRIYPPYAISLLLYLMVRLVLKEKVPSSENVITHFLLIFNYFQKTYFYSINAVYWSLAVEAQFYILLPIAAWAISRTSKAKSGTLVMAMMAVGLVSRTVEVLGFGSKEPAGEIRYTSIFAYLDWFASGMAVALFEVRKRAQGRWIVWLIFGAGVYLLGTNWHYFASRSPIGSANDLASAIGYPTLVCLGLGMILRGIRAAPPEALRIIKNRPLVWVGTISYSIFLYHIGVQVALQRVWPMRSLTDLQSNNIAQAMTALPLTLLLSALMYLTVERPCLQAIARLKKGSSPSRGRDSA